MAVSNKSWSLRYGIEHPTSLISYIGGKSALIPNIIPIIQFCQVAYGLQSFYELCGGGARMLLNLPPNLFPHRVYNDMDRGLCNLFACLGDRQYLYDLMALLEDLGVGEDVFLRAKSAREFESRMLAQGRTECELDMVTSAAYMFIVAMQSRAADCSTFDSSRVSIRSRLSAYFKRVRQLHQFYSTLCDVEVTHGSCLEWLDVLRGRDDVFIYLDPPYAPESMKLTDHYGDRSWSSIDHDLLVNKLLASNAKVALSGYDNEYYARLVEAGWRKLFLKTVFVSSSAKIGRYNNEYLWVNFEVSESLLSQVCEIDYSIS